MKRGQKIDVGVQVAARQTHVTFPGIGPDGVCYELRPKCPACGSTWPADAPELECSCPWYPTMAEERGDRRPTPKGILRILRKEWIW